MDKPKITQEHIRNYLGTGLKYVLLDDYFEEYNEFYDCENFEEGFKKGAVWEIAGYTEVDIPAGEGELSGPIIQFNGFYTDSTIATPMFYRLSDLNTLIPALGFVPIEEIYRFLRKNGMPEPQSQVMCVAMESGSMPILNAPFIVVQKLIEWHFWVFDQKYFDEGLVLDKMTYPVSEDTHGGEKEVPDV